MLNTSSEICNLDSFKFIFDCLYLIVRLYSELKDLTLDSPNAPNAFHGFVVRAQESSILLNSFFQ